MLRRRRRAADLVGGRGDLLAGGRVEAEVVASVALAIATAHLGFGRTVASGIEAPDILANLV